MLPEEDSPDEIQKSPWEHQWEQWLVEAPAYHWLVSVEAHYRLHWVIANNNNENVNKQVLYIIKDSRQENFSWYKRFMPFERENLVSH